MERIKITKADVGQVNVSALVPEPRIVAAVGTASSVGAAGRTELSARIEEAMADAVNRCLADGVPIQDSKTIRAAMMEARKKVLEPTA